MSEKPAAGTAQKLPFAERCVHGPTHRPWPSGDMSTGPAAAQMFKIVQALRSLESTFEAPSGGSMSS